MCHQVAIILTDFKSGMYITEVPNGEQLEFIDYCADAAEGKEPFFLPDEVAPFEIVPCK